MKTRWIWTALGAVPFLAAILTLESCGGEGGPVGGDGGGGLPSVTQQFLNLLAPEQANATYVGSERCSDGSCHGGRSHSRGDESVYNLWADTEHADRNVGCERCHGPGSAHVADPSGEGKILTFPKVTNPVVCAQCHGKLYDELKQSQHFKLIEAPVEEAISNPNQYGKNSRCIACHSGLFRTEIYEKDGPGEDMTATLDNAVIQEIAENTINHVPHVATCATCHNPHKKTGYPNADGEEKQIRHLTFNSDTGPIAPSQAAAVFTKFNHICAQCHNGRGADGSDAKLAASNSTSRPNMHDSNQFNTLMGIGGSEGPTGPIERNMAHAQAPGQCSKCHMPDARHTFTVSYDKGCAPCHTAADAAARQNSLSNEITGKLLALRSQMETWANNAYPASLAGYTPSEMDPRLRPYLWEYSSNLNSIAAELGIDTSDAAKMPPTTHQTSVPIQVRRARHNYYFVVRDSSICPHNPPYSRYLMQWAKENMDGLLTTLTDRSRNPYAGLSLKQKLQILAIDRERAKKSDLDAIRRGED